MFFSTSVARVGYRGWPCLRRLDSRRRMVRVWRDIGFGFKENLRTFLMCLIVGYEHVSRMDVEMENCFERMSISYAHFC